MPRGGARKGAGRKKHKPELTANKALASEILGLCDRPIHAKGCRCELCQGWYWLHECKDERIRWEARKYYTDKRDGKPVSTVNHIHDKPIEMNVTVSLADEIRKARERSAQR